MRDNFLTDNDKSFIIKNKDILFPSQIAKVIKHSSACVRSFLKRNNLKYKTRVYNPYELTEAELNIMTCLIKEYNIDEIAKEGNWSISTVKTHINNICLKYQTYGKNRILIAVLRYLKEKGLLIE